MKIKPLVQIIKPPLLLEDGCYVNKKLRLKSFLGKGKGLITTKKIKRGEIIALSGGMVFPDVELRRSPKNQRQYCYHLENNFFMCPMHFSKKSRIYYMNHSCSPNAGGMEGDALTTIALRDIGAGEEVTEDYRKDYRIKRDHVREWRVFRCRCGEKNCSGTIRA